MISLLTKVLLVGVQMLLLFVISAEETVTVLIGRGMHRLHLMLLIHSDALT